MKLLRCPINGLRPLQEFSYGGPVRPMPDTSECSDGEWADYIYNRSGEPGVKWEWWYHISSGVWFVAKRDTQNDEIHLTCLLEELSDHE